MITNNTGANIERSTSNVQRPTEERLSTTQSCSKPCGPSDWQTKCKENGCNTTTQLPSWQKTEPPKDGTEIIAIGKVMWRDLFSTTADPFVGAIRWYKDQSDYEGWHYSDTGMAVAHALDDEVIVHYWSLFPEEGGAL
jgi:hypothetical protein